MAAKKEAPKAPESAKPDDGTVRLTSPFGSKVTVSADQVDVFKDAGYTSSK